MRLKSRSGAVLIALLLAACSFSGSLPLPQQLPESRIRQTPWYQLTQYDAAGRPVRDTLLTITAADGGLRFVQTDPLGAPLARQQLRLPQGWQTDGFLPPNAAARRLFAAIVPLLAEQPAAVYPQLAYQAEGDGGRFSRGAEVLWRWQRNDDGYRLILPDGSQWQLSPLLD